ncbi:MAG: ribosomal RNA small subunit methyltransferase A [Candidatus Taylorbacteria bacterium]|nr:ribosomal RNA small subunit methyltransferase A [Candidatus Taylorbacteria bacterium]
MVYAKKSLGQNFLRSKKAINDIVLAGKIIPGETVLEAGPGEGVLTEALLKAGAKVIAIEKDRRLVPLLSQKFALGISSTQLTLIEDDILKFDPSAYKLIPGSYKLIANIPYYITGAFIRKFLEAEKQPETMVILVQKEVAERIVARDGKESILSISVKAYGVPKIIGIVKAGCFVPPPSVDSAILSIENISKKFFDGFSEEEFFCTVKMGFLHKRKKLSGNLRELGDIKSTLSRLGMDANVRPEDLSLKEWREVTQLLQVD